MITKQAIQASANVIRITEVKVGDVYKRFSDSDSYEDRVYYGIVKAIHNDGENAIIEAVEYCYRYSDITVELKVMKGTKEYTIFPATPEDLNTELDKARIAQVRAIEKANEEIAKANRLIKEIDGLISGETQKKLQSMSYKELTQTEYSNKMKEIN